MIMDEIEKTLLYGWLFGSLLLGIVFGLLSNPSNWPYCWLLEIAFLTQFAFIGSVLVLYKIVLKKLRL